ncbi:MAG: PmoA family protein, partial [Acidobacteriota bacterium]
MFTPNQRKLTGTGGSLTRRRFLEAGAAAALTAPAAGQPPKRVRLAHAKGESVSFLYGDQPLFDYRYAASKPKTYVHPLYAPNGIPITLDGTPDHIHHRGCMLAWTNVNGFDFWGEIDPGAKGRIVHQRFESMQDGVTAELTAINHWIGGGRALLAERRTLRAPAPSREAVWLEWESELRALQEPVSLRIEHEGQPSAMKAVYDGLGVRFVYSMNSGRVLNAKGETEIHKVNGAEAPWCAFAGPLETDSHGGAAIFDHPKNPRYPTPFYVAAGRTFAYLSAAPTLREPLNLKAGQVLRLRYAVVTFVGPADRAKLERLYREWTTKGDLSVKRQNLHCYQGLRQLPASSRSDSLYGARATPRS